MTSDDTDPPLHIPGYAIAEALRRAATHTDELLAADLEVVAKGVTVRIVCVDEVQAWLRTLASRAEFGDPLVPPPG